MDVKIKNNFKVRYSDLEVYIFGLGSKASENFAKTLKQLERCIGETCSDSFQPSIMTETPATFPDPDISLFILYMGVEHPKTDANMIYLKNKNIDEAICQKLRKKYVYEADIQKIYNLIVCNINEQLQEKAASDATFQAVKTVREPIRYLIILTKICFSNKI